MSDKYKLIAKIGAATAALVVFTVALYEGTVLRTYRDPIGIVSACTGHTGNGPDIHERAADRDALCGFAQARPGARVRQAAHERRPESGFPELCIQRGQWYFLLEHAGAQGQRQGHAGRLRRAESLDLCRWQAAAWLGQSPRSRAQAV